MPSGTSTYTLYESFADHTDKKFWRIPFYFQASGSISGTIGLQLKINGTWQNSNYTYQWAQFWGDNEIAGHSTSHDDMRFPMEGKEIGGEITFYDPHANRRTLFRVDNGWRVEHNWDTGGSYDQSLWSFMGGWRGTNAQVQGIRFSTGQAIGFVHHAVLASNGW